MSTIPFDPYENDFDAERSGGTTYLHPFLDDFGHERDSSTESGLWANGAESPDFGHNVGSNTSDTASNSTIQTQQRRQKRTFGQTFTDPRPRTGNSGKNPRYAEPTSASDASGVTWNTSPPSTFRGGIAMGGKRAPIQARTLYNVQNQNGKLLNFRRGDIITLLKVNCWAGRNMTAEEGVFHEEHVRFVSQSDHKQGALTLVRSPRRGQKELSFARGESITDIQIIWWKAENELGELGYVSSRCIEVIEDDDNADSGTQPERKSKPDHSPRDQSIREAEHRNELLAVPQMEKDCAACKNIHNAEQFAKRITANCTHENRTCRSCVQQWIASQLETASWDHIRCPGPCKEVLQGGDIQKHAAKHTFQRYTQLSQAQHERQLTTPQLRQPLHLRSTISNSEFPVVHIPTMPFRSDSRASPRGGMAPIRVRGLPLPSLYLPPAALTRQ